MNERSLTIREVLTHPNVREWVSQEDADRISASLAASVQAPKDPMYIRVLSGIGAWFAAVFLILFIAMSDMFESGVSTITCGIIFLAAAVAMARASRAVFLNQFSLALAFAGNVLTLIGITLESTGPDVSVIMVTHAVICLVVYPLYTSGIYRFLAPIVLAALAAAWILEMEAFVLFHALVAVAMLLAGVLLLHRRRPALLTPLTYAAAAMLPATLLFMNLMQMDVWRTNFDEPLWPSNLVLAGGLIYLYIHLAGGPKRVGEPWLVLAIVSTLVLGILTTPGIFVAVGLLILGRAFGDRILPALAYLFLPCFLVLFYYALTIDLAHKSWVIAGSGVLLLVVRWMVGRCQPKEVAG